MKPVRADCVCCFRVFVCVAEVQWGALRVPIKTSITIIIIIRRRRRTRFFAIIGGGVLVRVILRAQIAIRVGVRFYFS